MIVEAIDKVYDYKGRVIGYKMRDTQGNVMDATTDSIKRAIMNGSVTVVNLQITSDGRLVTKGKSKNTVSKTNTVSTSKKTKAVKAPSYYGIEIRNLNKFIGREGEAYQGDVYYYGEKLGFWSQDGNGAIRDRFEFNKNILKEPMNKCGAGRRPWGRLADRATPPPPLRRSPPT